MASGCWLAVLVPLMLYLHGRLAGDLAEVRRDLHALAERVARVEAGIGALDARTARLEAATLAYGDRVARMEGAMNGPWRPANGAPAPTTPPEATPMTGAVGDRP